MTARSRTLHRRTAAVDGAEPAIAEAPRTFTADVRLFAWVAELADRRSVTLELKPGAIAAGVILQALKLAGLDDDLALTGSVRLAVNREFAAPGMAIERGDELALIPPIAGGAPVHVAVTDRPLDLARLHDLVALDDASAVVTFTGRTCAVEVLHFEAYEEMVQARIEQIAADLMQGYRLSAVAIEHRVGAVATGEASVVVAVSARERAAAFAAAREAIDRVKGESPIWQLEIDAGFRSWVRGAAPSARG